jgi:hypothetical protein
MLASVSSCLAASGSRKILPSSSIPAVKRRHTFPDNKQILKTNKSCQYGKQLHFLKAVILFLSQIWLFSNNCSNQAVSCGMNYKFRINSAISFSFQFYIYGKQCYTI